MTTKPLSQDRINQIRAMEPADAAPEQVAHAITDLWREIERQRRELARLEAAPESGSVTVTMTREDATELAKILMEERMRLDKDGRRPVPQPRWGANVRIAHAVAAALDSTPED